MTQAQEKLSASERRQRRRARRERVVVVHSDDGDGNWLVSYADMMTLLFGFFVIVSAFSTPDAAKMEKLKQRTAEAVGGKYVKPFEELSAAIQKLLSEIDLKKEVDIVETADGVTIVSKGTLFFDSGSAVLKSEAQKLMTHIAYILSRQAKGFRIVVEGHTDDAAIQTQDFPSNWELSSVRAGAVVRLLEGQGIPRKDLRPVGLADTEPLVPNRDRNGTAIPQNQAENRRIVIRIQKQLPSRMGSTSATPQAAPPGKAARADSQ